MSVNVLQNGKIVKLAGAVESDVIDQAVELATKQAVATAAAYAETIVAQAGGFHSKVVDRLPLGADDPEDEEFIMTNTMYFVPNVLALSTGKNMYDEYMFINNRWEQITKSSISLSDLDKEFSDYLNKIYSAIGESDDGELYSVHERIYNEAAQALYKESDDGTVVTIAEAISELEQFRDNLNPITEKEIESEFQK